MTRWAALGLLCLLPGMALADPCALTEDPAAYGDGSGTVVEVRGFKWLAVTRFESPQGLGAQPVEPKLWTDDVPSATFGEDKICDRIQLESALPFSVEGDATLVMQQGERPLPDLDLAQYPELLKRLKASERIVDVPAGRYFAYQIPDFEAIEWREQLFSEAGKTGKIDPNRWVIALPGALYLVPLKP